MKISHAVIRHNMLTTGYVIIFFTNSKINKIGQIRSNKVLLFDSKGKLDSCLTTFIKEIYLDGGYYYYHRCDYNSAFDYDTPSFPQTGSEYCNKDFKVKFKKLIF